MVYTLICHLLAKDDASIALIAEKLKEAALIYRKDKEQIDWLVMQDTVNPRKFSIVERFETEDSQKYHLGNPYWKTFDPYVLPLLEGPIELRRLNELV